MVSTAQAAIQQLGTFIMACILVGGSIWLEATRGDVPMWLVGFDGAAVAFVFSNAQSFVQARTALPTHLALEQAQATVHALATGGTLSGNPMQSGMTGGTGGHS